MLTRCDDGARAWKANALIQVLYSTGPGWGVVLAFGSFLDVTAHTVRPALFIAGVNSSVGILAGIAVFSVLGHLAHERGVSVNDVAASGPELVFAVYPAAVRLFAAPNTVAVLFFAMMVMLGFNSIFATVQTLTSSTQQYVLPERWRERVPRSAVTSAVCIAMFGAGLFFASGAGSFWLDWADAFVPLVTLFVITLLEALVFGWAYGRKLLAGVRRIREGSGTPPLHRAWLWLWRVPTPLALLVVTGLQVAQTASGPVRDGRGNVLPRWAAALGGVVAALPTVALAAYALAYYRCCAPSDAAAELRRVVLNPFELLRTELPLRHPLWHQPGFNAAGKQRNQPRNI